MRRLVVVVAALVLGACGGGGTKTVTPVRTLTARTTTTPATTPTVPTTTTTVAPTPTVTPPTTTTPTTTTPTPTATTPTVPTVTATTPTQTTSPAPAVASCGTVAGGFISGIQGLGVGCSEARATAQDWLRSVQAGGRPQGPLPANGLTCRGRLRGERASVACVAPDGRLRVTFRASP